MKTNLVYSCRKGGYGITVLLLTWTMILAEAAGAANWYVDNALTTSGNGQSWASAFNQFSSIAWSSIRPGDTLYISGGTTSKTYSSYLNIGADGTSTSKITIRVGQEAGHNGTVILNGVGIITSYADHVTIDGSVGNTSKLWIQNISSSNKDDAWAIHNGGTGGVGLTVRYVTITNCNNGINLTYADSFEIDHNSITVKGDAGIRAIANPQHGFGWNKIHHNWIYSLDKVGYGGPDSIQGSNSTDIYNNQFFAVASADAVQGQHPDSIQIGGVRYVRIYGNTFNNIADSNIDNDAFGSGQFVDIHIYNNLFIQTQNLDLYPDSIRFYSTGSQVNTMSNIKILNNTFVDKRPNKPAGSGQIIGISWNNGSGAGAGNELKNNLAYGTVDGLMLKYGGSSLILDRTNNIYPQAQAFDPSAIIGTPLLDANFIPTSLDSLARDRGLTLPYFSTDQLGTSRPQGIAWDIGAFEFSTQVPLQLAPPTNLRVL